MSQLVLALDALYALRDAAPSRELDPVAAVKLAELAGADAVRVGVGEGLHAVRESDAHELRRVARTLEVKVAPGSVGLKVALEVRPDRVLLASAGRAGVPGWGVLDLGAGDAGLGPTLRALGEAGIPAYAAVAPDVDAVKAAHAAGFAGVELFTAHAVDLPPVPRGAVLERLGDAARLAAKLRVPVSLGGGLDERSLAEVAARAPAAERIAIGRALLARALLVGIERALRDLRARLR